MTPCNELDVVRQLDFDWALKLAEVWNDTYDDPNLHSAVREKFSKRFDRLIKHSSDATLGWIITGPAGAGKTHLLGHFRRAAWDKGATFILVDMTGVRDFWETLLQAMIGSLQQRVDENIFQFQMVVQHVIKKLGAKNSLSDILKILANRKSTRLVDDVAKVLHALSKLYPQETRQHQDVVRALICWNSEDFGVSNVGYTWLQGQSLTQDERETYKFVAPFRSPIQIVKSLSWLLSISGPTIIAFDQVDVIMRQFNVANGSDPQSEQARTAWGIIQMIGEGLGTLRDNTTRALPIVACLESSLPVLKGVIPQPYLDRFEFPETHLNAISSDEIMLSIVRQRLERVFAQRQFKPPYPTWPFKSTCFQNTGSITPRELLKLCHERRNELLENGTITELESVTRINVPVKDKVDFSELDRRFAKLKADATIEVYLDDKKSEEQFPGLLAVGLQCLAKENVLPNGVRAEVQSEFTGGTTTRPLHARLLLVHENDEEREEVYCLRGIQHTHHRAFQVRLTAAMTESGIDRSLPFRHLAIIRRGNRPTGQVTQDLVVKFEKAGGVWIDPTDDELKTLAALKQLREAADPLFDAWLLSRQPASKTNLLKLAILVGLPDSQSKPEVGNILTSIDASKETSCVTKELECKTGRKKEEHEHGDKTRDDLVKPTDQIPLGKKHSGDQVTILLPIELLPKHSLVLAGAGSGKTVLLKRLIEEAALRGIPSVVIDFAGDLKQLAEDWKTPPPTWSAKDAALAKRFRQTTEVLVWTPGLESEKPLAFEPIPDLRNTASSEDELSNVVAMICEMLIPMVAPGNTAAASNKQGLLSKALRHFVRTQHSLTRFIDYLKDLPEEARLGINNEENLARQIADSLTVAREKNTLLRSVGEPLNPANFFCGSTSQTTRISVISFAGLPSLEGQRIFLAQLATTLFGWIKQNPPATRAMHGLLILDEARDFVPSVKASTCKESFKRLAAQARKYKLGVLFATQNPKDIDNAIVSNCSTHFYGKMNSPAAIDATIDMIKLKGGNGDDVARLPKGQFYVHNADAEMLKRQSKLKPRFA